MKKIGLIRRDWQVRDILKGGISQARVVLKPQPTKLEDWRIADWRIETGTAAFNLTEPELRHVKLPWLPQPGDALWVRETFYCDDYRYPAGPRHELLGLMEYRATHDCRYWEAGCPCRDDEGRGNWRPSIHMPRWASRITLTLTGVRVERVQDISGMDCVAEGAWRIDDVALGRSKEAIAAYQKTWDGINGKRPGAAWADNPWVIVYEWSPLAARDEGAA